MWVEVPHDVVEGKPLPGAAWYGQLLSYLRTCRVRVARDSGLEATVEPAGTRLSIVLPKRPKFAVTTSAVPVRSGTTFGKGTAKLCDVVLSPAGVATYTTRADAIAVYHGGPTNPVATGHLVQLKWIDDVPFIDVDYC